GPGRVPGGRGGGAAAGAPPSRRVGGGGGGATPAPSPPSADNEREGVEGSDAGAAGVIGSAAGTGAVTTGPPGLFGIRRSKPIYSAPLRGNSRNRLSPKLPRAPTSAGPADWSSRSASASVSNCRAS